MSLEPEPVDSVNDEPPIAASPLKTATEPALPSALSASEEQLSEPSFLHPSSVIFEALSHIRQYIIPAIVGLAGVARGSFWGVGFAVLVFGGSLGATLLRYFTLRYRIQDKDFIVTEGLIFRRVRSVPIRRIQNMDLVQNPLHRIFGVAEVNIETASGTKPEATLRVLTHTQIQELRRAIFGEEALSEPELSSTPGALSATTAGSPLANGVGDAAPSDATQHALASAAKLKSEGKLLATISTRQLVLAGLTSNRGTVILGVLVGLFFQADYEWRSNWDFLRGLIPSQDEPSRFVFILIAASAGLFLALRFLGIAWYVLRFFGYRLTRRGEDLRISCGLFTKVSATVPRKRIQFISVHRPLFMRWLKLASIRIETAGGAGTEGESAASTVSRRWFLPVVDEDHVNSILQELRPGFDWEVISKQITWHGVSPLTERRLTRLALVLSLLAAGLGLAGSQPWGWILGPLLFPFAWFLARKKSRSKRYARTDQGIAYQSGVFTRRLSFAFYDRMQAVQVSQSPFDRRWKMASLVIDTAASGPAEHTIDVNYLDRSFAIAQFEDLQRCTARNRPSWA